ncbi:MAG: methyltransferase domain-containing protein, partial [Gammaproteobacteria bacterium]|nr:methyltransferase domain-containing protein [Gammaproteobacteria bacterium]
MPASRTARTAASLAFAALLLTACAATGPATRSAAAKPDAALAAVLAGPQRSAEQKERDGERHPGASLAFWGLKPGASILEVSPGAGWWTQVLAPYAARTGGRYAATAADLTNPATSAAARQGRETFAKNFSDTAVYGRVELVDWGPAAPPLPEGRYDFILLSRVIHNWMRQDGALDRNFAQLARGLKRGGSLAVEQHRAAPGGGDPKGATGYVSEQTVIDAAARAGLKLVAKSEINANPKDTKDHPFG